MSTLDDPAVLAAVFARAQTFLAVLAADGTLLAVNHIIDDRDDADDRSDVLIGPEALGNPLWEADGWSAAALATAVRRAAAGEAARCEIEVARRDRPRRWFAVSVTPLATLGEGGPRLLVEGHDLSARALRERQAGCADDLYRVVLDTQTEIVSRLRPDGVLLFVNDAYCAFVGRTREALLGQRWHMVAHPDDIPHVERELAGMTSKTPIVIIENRVFDGAGRLRWMEFVNRGFHDPDGALVELQSIGRDISARKRHEAEHQEAARRFHAWQRFESLGLLASGIASELNNVLASVLTHVVLARRELPPGSGAGGSLDEIEVTGGRAAHLSRMLLSYAGKSRVSPQRVDLNTLIGESLPLVRAALSACTLGIELGLDLPVIHGDPAELQDILMNLALNASDAVRERGGLVTIRTRCARVDQATLQRYVLGAERAPGEYAALSVIDDGCGMSDEVLSRCFEPFYSTSARGRGLGLGLAATLGLVRAHGGAIRIDTAPGRGTTIEVLLPRAPTPLMIVGHPAVPRPTEPGALLIVDDDDDVRLGLARWLESIGYTVLQASGGAEALTLLRAPPRPIGCLLLDLVMPRMTGDELLRQLHALQLEVPVIIMSEDVRGLAETLGGHPVIGCLQKPFGLHELQALLPGISATSL